MKFTTSEDLEAEVGAVFDIISDFDMAEHAAMRRGVHVARRGTGSDVGTTWDTKFNLRGKEREAEIELIECNRPSTMRLDTRLNGLDAVAKIELVPLSKTHTRMIMDVKLSPTSLSARLMVQSLKLARNNMNKRFKKRIAQLAKGIEQRARRG